MSVIPARLPLHRRDGSLYGWALVDPDMVWRLGRFRWSVVLKDRGVEKVRRWRRRSDGTQTTQAMHHAVIGKPPAGFEVDHIDGNPLNNRRSNLRVVTHAQNQQNVSSHRDSTSRYRGVSWDRRGYWIATAQIDGHKSYLGRFDLEEDAARAAADFRRVHLPFAVESRHAI